VVRVFQSIPESRWLEIRHRTTSLHVSTRLNEGENPAEELAA